MPVFSSPEDRRIEPTPEDALWGALGGGKSSWADSWFEGFGMDDLAAKHLENENKAKLREYESARTYERVDCSNLYGDTQKQVGEGTGYLFAGGGNDNRGKRKRYTASDWQQEMDDAFEDSIEQERRQAGELFEDDPEYSAFDVVTCEGDSKIKKIKFLLDDILKHRKWTREEAQKKLHRSYLIASLPELYKEDWAVHSARVLKIFGVTDLKSLVLAIYARRFGKTVSIANFVVPVLAVDHGVTISTFSTGRRASGNLTDECIKLLSENEHLWNRILVRNQEKLRLAVKERVGNEPLSPINASTFNSYPVSATH